MELKGKTWEKRKRFCHEYIIDLNGSAAAVRAGYSPKSSVQTASEILANPNVKEYLEQILKERAGRNTITQDFILTRLKDVSDKCYSLGKYNDCIKATELLGRHLGIFEKDNTQRVNNIIIPQTTVYTSEIPLASNENEIVD